MTRSSGTSHLLVLVCFALLTFSSQAESAEPCNVQRSLVAADSLLKLKRYNEAKARLSALQHCGDLSPATRFDLGWLWGRSRDFRSALRIFQSVPADVPDRVTHQYAIALTQFELQDYQASAQVLKDLAKELPLDSKSANLLAVSYSKLGLYQEAHTELTENLRRNPNDLFSYLNLITLLADAGHFSDAADVASQAVVVFPGNSDVMVVRGAALTLMGQLDQAHADFASAAQLSPKQASVRFFLAMSEYRQGHFEGSIEKIKTATKSGVIDSDLYYLLAECHLKTEPANLSLALDDLKRSIDLNPRSVAARTLRGKLLLEAGKINEALHDLEFAHRIDPASRSATYNFARAELKLGKTVNARALFRKLQAQNSDSLTELSDQRLHEALGTASP